MKYDLSNPKRILNFKSTSEGTLGAIPILEKSRAIAVGTNVAEKMTTEVFAEIERMTVIPTAVNIAAPNEMASQQVPVDMNPEPQAGVLPTQNLPENVIPFPQTAVTEPQVVTPQEFAAQSAPVETPVVASSQSSADTPTMFDPPKEASALPVMEAPTVSQSNVIPFPQQSSDVAPTVQTAISSSEGLQRVLTVISTIENALVELKKEVAEWNRNVEISAAKAQEEQARVQAQMAELNKQLIEVRGVLAEVVQPTKEETVNQPQSFEQATPVTGENPGMQMAA